MLQVRNLEAYYDKSHVLQGVDLDVAPGEIVSLLGRNGVGRSTTLKAIMGEVAAAGSVTLHGRELAGLPTHLIARAGIGYVPENRDVFGSLTVRQNLLLGTRARGKAFWTVDRIFSIFPRLKERADVAAGSLSGGEQQMLTMGRSLVGNPAVLLVDEPTEGLAPKIVEEIGSLLQAVADQGTGILLVEQKLAIAMRISRRVFVMGRGRVVYQGTTRELLDSPDIMQSWMSV
ncbi:ABC transporter ATP-binding protein [Ferrovibrio sp.]|uniref:ABC transporter ATP-binding protein n=1 Tax=Ferrovibrio sp. TaxID=1917215 RepID=UPI003D2D7A2A